MSRVKSSSRPKIIKIEHTNVANGDNTEKFIVGPKILKPGPIFPRHVAAADSEDTRSNPSREMSRNPAARSSMYANRKYVIFITTSFPSSFLL